MLLSPLLSGCGQARPEAAAADDLKITLHSGSEDEEQAAAQFRRILATYDTQPWTFTRHVRFESGAIPHSHPTLTLSTRSLDDDPGQLATYLHEQIHWFLSARDEAVAKTIAALRQRYPDVPVGYPDGARNEYSTYLHLIVCRLELDAATHFLGERQARDLLAGKRYYRWVYARVLEDTAEIGALLSANDLLIRPGR